MKRTGEGTLCLLEDSEYKPWRRVSYEMYEQGETTLRMGRATGRIVRVLDDPTPLPLFDAVGKPAALELANGEWWLCTVANVDGTLANNGGLQPAGRRPSPPQ